MVLLVSSLFMVLTELPQGAKAEENWLNGWNYRKSVEASSGPHVITTHYNAGNDVLGHVYLDGACQPDFDDIRFTGPDGQTLISGVTIRTRIDGEYAEFKVNVGSSPIYVYYGNPAATSYYDNEVLGSGSFGDTDQLSQSYVAPAGGQISGIAMASPVTGYATSLEAVVSSESDSTVQMALLLMRNFSEEDVEKSTPWDMTNFVQGRRVVALTETKTISDPSKHREVFMFDSSVPIFKGTLYGIALLAGEGTRVYYQTGGGSASFDGFWSLSKGLLLHTGGYENKAFGRFVNYEMVDWDEQDVLFRDNADYTGSRSMWHGHYEYNGEIDVASGQGVGGSYAFDSTVFTPDDDGRGWGELAFLGSIGDGNKRFWSGVVRLSALPDLGSHVELMATLRYPEYDAMNGFGVDRTNDGVQWRLSVLSGTDVWSHTLFGEVEADTDYLVILSYEMDGVYSTSEVWVTNLDEPDLLLEDSPSEALTATENGFGNMFFIGAADYPLGAECGVSAISVFFDEMALTENFPATFGAWKSEVINSVTEIPLAGWEMDSRYTNADYTLNSQATGISLQFNPEDTNSIVTIVNWQLPQLALSDYNYMNVAVTGTSNALIRIWLYLDDGSYITFAYREDASTVNARDFDLSPYSERALNGAGFIELTSTNTATTNIDITEIAFNTGPIPTPTIPLYGWKTDTRYTNTDHVLNSASSGISLQLDPEDTNSIVTIVNWNLPHLTLSNYNYIDITAIGSTNALIRIWLYLDDGSYITFAYREDTNTVNARNLDLTPYADRTLNGAGFIELTSSNGVDTNIDITEIAFMTGPLPSPMIPLYGWRGDPRYINAEYALDSSASGISLDLDAADTNSVVTLVQWDLPQLVLSDYSYMDVAVTGSTNALLRIWLYLDDGTYITFAYREDVGAVNGRILDLTPFADRTLNGAGFVELMSFDGVDASIDVTEIALVT
jgi:hypothetical protein